MVKLCRYDDLSQSFFYAVIMMRLFNACKLCSRMHTRIVIAVCTVPNGDQSAAQAQIMRQLVFQMHHQRIDVNVLGGFLALNYSLFGAVNVEQVQMRSLCYMMDMSFFVTDAVDIDKLHHYLGAISTSRRSIQSERSISMSFICFAMYGM